MIRFEQKVRRKASKGAGREETSMKRNYWYILIICILVAAFFAGCGKDSKTTDDAKEPTKVEEPANQTPDTPTPDEPGTGEPGQDHPDVIAPGPQPQAVTMEQALDSAPENYDCAVRVSINPDFLLYVENGSVIGHAPLNEDAAKLEDRVALDGRRLEDALNDIVRFSHQDGYLKDGGDVKVTIVAAKTTRQDAEEILHKAEAAITESAQQSGVTANPVVQVETTVQFEPDTGEDPGQPGGDPGQPGEDPNEPGGEPRKEEGCSVCWGTGDCERCEATGKVECMECDHGYVHCSMCGGSGGNAELPCTKCGGTGKEMHEACGGTGMTDCEQCHGTKKCPACGGTGKKPED